MRNKKALTISEEENKGVAYRVGETSEENSTHFLISLNTTRAKKMMTF